MELQHIDIAKLRDLPAEKYEHSKACSGYRIGFVWYPMDREFFVSINHAIILKTPDMALAVALFNGINDTWLKIIQDMIYTRAKFQSL